MNPATPGAETAAPPTVSQTRGHRNLGGERHDRGQEGEQIQGVLGVIDRFLGTGTSGEKTRKDPQRSRGCVAAGRARAYAHLRSREHHESMKPQNASAVKL